MRTTVALMFAFAVASSAQSVVGSGGFRTVQEAVDASPSHSRARFTIHIKPGIYRERVTVPPEKTFLRLEGEDAVTTVITAGIHAGMPGPDGRPLITFGTPTVFIQANDFVAENLTFENSAGAQGQALALTIMSDRGVFRKCRFLGYQDTLLAQAGRQLFDHCYIEGAVDFIFGGSAAWFEACEIHVKADGYITAPNTPKDQRFGYVFSHCTITSEPGVRTYLSRPWRPYGFTYFLDTEMSDAVRPEGWNNWNDVTRQTTVRYGEIRSSGPGSGQGARVLWVHALTEAQARDLSIASVLGGLDGWNPVTGAVRLPVIVAKEATVAKASIAGDAVWLAVDTSGITTSPDGYNWSDTKATLPAGVVAPRLAEGPDQTFHMVWATGTKGEKRIGYASSKDLTNWSEPRYIEVMGKQDALGVVSPNLFYDEVSRRFVVTWASTISKNFIQSFQEEVEDNPRIWYTTTRDFQTLSDAELLFDPNYSVRDATVMEDRGRYVMLHNDNTRPMQDLRVSSSSTPFGPWGQSSDSFTDKFTEAPAAVQSGREWWIYYWNAQTGTAGLAKSRDFHNFQDASSRLAYPKGRHPLSVLKVERAIADRLRH